MPTAVAKILSQRIIETGNMLTLFVSVSGYIAVLLCRVDLRQLRKLPLLYQPTISSK